MRTRFCRRTFLLVVMLFALGCARGRVGDNVSLDTIVSVQPGMSYAEVVGKIGTPFQMEAEVPPHVEGGVRIQGEMKPTSDPNGTHVLLTYSRPGGWLVTYPMVWVHLRQGKVSEIYVKQYFAGRPFFGDDDGIYGYSVQQPRWQKYAQLRAALAR